MNSDKMPNDNTTFILISAVIIVLAIICLFAATATNNFIFLILTGIFIYGGHILKNDVKVKT